MNDFNKDLEVDKNNLDKEWEKQAAFFNYWANKEVEAYFEKDKAKEELELIKAQLDSEIRIAAKENNEKITEGAITSRILSDQKYSDANDRLIEANRTLRTYSVAKEALEHKKKSLEKLADLWISGYWAEPKVRNEAKERKQSENTQETTDQLNQNKRLRARKNK